MINLRKTELKADILSDEIDDKTARFVIVFCNFNPTKIFWLYCSVLLVLQLIARQIEILINGEPAPAIYDPIMVGILVGHYLKTMKKMTYFLLTRSIKK